MLELFRHAWPDVDVDIRAGLAFEALPALNREEVDLVISSDPVKLDGVTFNPLFDYHPMFVAAAANPLAAKAVIVAEDFRDQMLITYPVARDRLDVFTEVLTPARVEPRGQRQVELTAVILMLVAANRGVSVLPDWVLREVKSQRRLCDAALGAGGHHEAALCGDADRGCDKAVHGAFPAAGPDGAGEDAAGVSGAISRKARRGTAQTGTGPTPAIHKVRMPERAIISAPCSLPGLKTLQRRRAAPDRPLGRALRRSMRLEIRAMQAGTTKPRSSVAALTRRSDAALCTFFGATQIGASRQTGLKNCMERLCSDGR